MTIPDIDKSRYVKYCQSLDVQQIAYPVGENKDAYYIETWYSQNVLTGTVTTRSSVVKNWYNSSKKEVLLQNTTFKACYEYIQSVIYPL